MEEAPVKEYISRRDFDKLMTEFDRAERLLQDLVSNPTCPNILAEKSVEAIKCIDKQRSFAYERFMVIEDRL